MCSILQRFTTNWHEHLCREYANRGKIHLSFVFSPQNEMKWNKKYKFRFELWYHIELIITVAHVAFTTLSVIRSFFLFLHAGGAHFDLRPLTVTDPASTDYHIIDGDIPCTPELEPSYNYNFNFCQDVTKGSLSSSPSGTVCSEMGKKGVALQSIKLSDKPEDQNCLIIGHYDPENDDNHFALLGIFYAFGRSLILIVRYV